MTTPRFLQIHTLHSYSAALLNRDDSGLAKRLPYGGEIRTRVSSQCLKRHWRMAENDPHHLLKIAGAEDAFRSRELVTLKVIEPLAGEYSQATIDVLDSVFQKQVYGEKGGVKKTRQTLLFGAPELNWLASQARTLAPAVDEAIKAANIDPTDKKAIEKNLKAAEEPIKEWVTAYKANIQALRDQNTLAAGLTSALFGRMVTSDPSANIDAPIHVAHAFTVHAEETESDYFVAVDDLKRDEDDSGADTIQEAELTSGLFYGYVVVDVPGLVKNLTGIENAEDWTGADRTMAAEVVHNLIYLIAEVSPGAKLGSTAPYGRAELLLVEAGDRQPRSLAGAFRDPAQPSIGDATQKLKQHLQDMDDNFKTGEARRALHFSNADLPCAPRGALPDIASWAKQAVLTCEAGK